MGTFCCFEVTIGIGGKERVDYLTYDTKGTWRCYEIKVSKSDFYSSAKVSFVGHYNYYVMPQKLFEEVKDDVPSHIGVIINGNWSKKKARKQALGVTEDVLKDSMIRSLYREAKKLIRSENPSVVENLDRRISQLQAENRGYRNRYKEMSRKYYELKYRENND